MLRYVEEKFAQFDLTLPERIACILKDNPELFPVPIIGGGAGPSTAISAPGGGGSSIAWQDEGVAVGTDFGTINFIGADVEALADSGTLNVYVPPIDFSDFFNAGTALVPDISTTSRYISNPTTEGNPFKIGSWTAWTQQSTINNATLTYATSDIFSIKSLTTTFTASIFDADDITEIVPYLQITLAGNMDTGYVNGIRIVVSDWVAEGTKYAANVTTYYNMATILSAGSGRFKISLVHDNGTDGTHSKLQGPIFYDTEPNPMTITGISIAENTPVTKYLSGIKYYTTSSTFDLGVSDIDDTNADTAPTNSLRLGANDYGISDTDIPASSLTGWSNLHDNENASYTTTDSIDMSNHRFFGNTANAIGYPIDWSVLSGVASPYGSILVDTYGTTSSNLIHTFDDESRRLKSDYTTAWDSTVALVADEALVMNGKLMVPNRSRLTGDSTALNADWTTYNPDLTRNYTSLGVGSGCSYYFKVTDAGGDRTGFTMTFAGSFVSSATTDLANSDLKIFVRRIGGQGDTGTGANPLLAHGQEYNFSTFDDGVSDGYIRENSSSGNTVRCTFGSWQCNGGIFVEIMLNNINIEIGNVSFAFS